MSQLGHEIGTSGKTLTKPMILKKRFFESNVTSFLKKRFFVPEVTILRSRRNVSSTLKKRFFALEETFLRSEETFLREETPTLATATLSPCERLAASGHNSRDVGGDTRDRWNHQTVGRGFWYFPP